MSSEGVADLAVRDANDRGTVSWRLVERLVGGVQSGAWRLEASDGSSAVLKLAPTRDWATQMQRAERSVGVVRAAGYPTPAWLVTGVMTSGIGYQVQEMVPGRPVDMLGTEQVRELVRVLERASFARVALDLVRFMSTAELALTDQQRTGRIRSLTARAQVIDRLSRV